MCVCTIYICVCVCVYTHRQTDRQTHTLTAPTNCSGVMDAPSLMLAQMKTEPAGGDAIAEHSSLPQSPVVPAPRKKQVKLLALRNSASGSSLTKTLVPDTSTSQPDWVSCALLVGYALRVGSMSQALCETSLAPGV